MNEASIDILCRLCLNKSYFFSNIYVGQSTDSDPIYETINYVYDLQISIDDGLPEYVCQECLSMVHEFEKYKKNARKVKLELIRLKRKIHEGKNPVNVKGESVSCKSSADDITAEVQDNNGIQIYIKQEVDDDCFDAASSVFPSGERLGDAETQVSLKKEEADELGSFDVEYPAIDQPVSTEAQITIKEEDEHIISEDSFEAGTVSGEERSVMETQVPYGPVLLKNEVLPFSREDNYQVSETIPTELPAEEYHPATAEEETLVYRGDTCQQFPCDVCSKPFRTRSCLKRHRKNHSDVKPFNCSICGKVYKRKSHLEDHIKKHSGIKSFVCAVCNKGFFRNTALVAHERTHTGVRPFQCQFCSRSFAQKGQLKHHSRSHSEERPFGCATCGARFKYKPVLIDHVSIHAKDKGFKCHLCPKKFRLKRLLKRHLIRHEGRSDCLQK